MNELVFTKEEFGEVRVSGTPEKPLFCLADVCRVLGIENSRNVKNRLDLDGVHTMDGGSKVSNQYGETTTEQTVQLTFIDEANLYRCIFQSRKKSAKDFQNWVYEEVLPEIRRRGGYGKQAMNDERFRAIELNHENIALKTRVSKLEKMRTYLEGERDHLKGALSEKQHLLEKAQALAQLLPDAQKELKELRHYKSCTEADFDPFGDFGRMIAEYASLTCANNLTNLAMWANDALGIPVCDTRLAARECPRNTQSYGDDSNKTDLSPVYVAWEGDDPGLSPAAIAYMLLWADKAHRARPVTKSTPCPF